MQNRIYLADALSVSTGLTYLAPLILFIMTNNPIHIKAFIGIGSTTIISESLKPFFSKLSPRPSQALNCNLLCNDGPQGGRSGMPSSHSATVAFLTGFYISEIDSIIGKLFLVGYAILVMASRYVKNCHTIPQIIIGALLGFSLSLLVRHL
jgi:membrane-associated phospholipid phosphatase